MSLQVQTRLVRGWRRLAFRWRRDELDRELAEEIESHRLLKQAENGRQGLTPRAARVMSLRQMGNIATAQEECREMRSFVTFDRLFDDLRFAVRMFARTPGFTAIAVLSLAIGIGGNAAMFGLVNKLLIQPLPYREPDRLVRLTGIYPRAAVPFFQQRMRTTDVAGVSVGTDLNLTGAGEAIRVFGCAASANFLAVLGAPVGRGRGFVPGEDQPGRDAVAIISDTLWKSKFGGDPAILGHVVALNGMNRVIVGIMPPGFAYPASNVQVWIPLRLDPSNFLEFWGEEFVPLIGRMHPAAALEQAQGEVRATLAQFRQTFPYPMAREWNADSTAIPLQRDIVGDIRSKLLILLASVAVVLLIACANIASLLLSRATTRRKEIALRVSLGAGRMRIVRQLLTESVLLALAGAVLGCFLGMAALRIFKSVLPVATPGLAAAAIDWPVVGAIAIVALLTGLSFGLAPALYASQVDLSSSIKSGSPRATTSSWARLRTGLIGAEVALTLVLVVSAGLLTRSLQRLTETHPGFQSERILTLRISPNQSLCMQRSACIALYERLVDRARGLSGVEDAAVANAVPLDGYRPTVPVDVEGHPKTADNPAPLLWSTAITPAYLDMLRIPLLMGRKFTPADSEFSARVLLISASTARHFWPGESGLGKHIRIAGEQTWRTVVGIVGDVHQFSLSQGLPSFVPGSMYMPYTQSARETGEILAAMTLVVRTTTDSARLPHELRRLAQDQDPNVPVGQVQPLDQVVSGSIADFRATIWVFLSFAGAAIVLAGIGIYGLVSHWVTQRTFEIGVRVALGAEPQRVLSLVMGQGLRVTLFGIAAGVAAAFAFTRFLASLLYGIVATDPLTFASVTMLVLGVALVSTLVPAFRASRIDPVMMLRTE